MEDEILETRAKIAIKRGCITELEEKMRLIYCSIAELKFDPGVILENYETEGDLTEDERLTIEGGEEG